MTLVALLVIVIVKAASNCRRFHCAAAAAAAISGHSIPCRNNAEAIRAVIALGFRLCLNPCHCHCHCSIRAISRLALAG